MIALYGSLFIVITSSVMYHLSAKLLSINTTPFGVLTISYAVALLICLGAWGFHPQSLDISTLATFKNWPILLMSVAIVGAEVGYFLLYKSGWKMGAVPLLVNGGAIVCFIPIGYLLFKERLNWMNLMGVALILGGIYLLNKK